MRKRPGRIMALWATFAAWAMTVTWLSSLPPWELPGAQWLFPSIPHWDKLAHFAAFVAGGWLAAKAIKTTFPSQNTRAGLLTSAAILTAASFGAFDEIFQLGTPGRHGADIQDWIADLLGASLGVAIATAVTRQSALAALAVTPLRRLANQTEKIPERDRRISSKGVSGE